MIENHQQELAQSRVASASVFLAGLPKFPVNVDHAEILLHYDDGQLLHMQCNQYDEIPPAPPLKPLTLFDRILKLAGLARITDPPPTLEIKPSSVNPEGS